MAGCLFQNSTFNKSFDAANKPFDELDKLLL